MLRIREIEYREKHTWAFDVKTLKTDVLKQPRRVGVEVGTLKSMAQW